MLFRSEEWKLSGRVEAIWRIGSCLEKIDAVNDYLMQGVNEKFTFEDEVKMLCDIFEEE